MTYGEHLIRYQEEQNAIPPWLKRATAQRHAPPPDEINTLERCFSCMRHEVTWSAVVGRSPKVLYTSGR